MTKRLLQRCSSARGQSLVEFALIIPLFMILVLGVVEFGYVLLDQHIVTSLTREGSNLISRDVPIQNAENVLATMSTRPVNFTTGSKLIFSVLLKVGTTGVPNYDQVVLYQRHISGDLSVPGSSALLTPGGSFGGAPDYLAANVNTDLNLRVSSMPANLTLSTGALMYVTEIYSTHTLLTPLNNFGITVPSTLYSIAYF